MAKTKIAWCQFSFNHIMGCTKVAPGCAHCYAEAFTKRTGKAKWGPNGTRTKTSEPYWNQPLKWNRDAEGTSERPRVFCASLADVFEEWKGPVLNHKGKQIRRCKNRGCTGCSGRDDQTGSACMFCLGDTMPLTLDDVRGDLFKLIDTTPSLDWLLLTKRPENISRMWPADHWVHGPEYTHRANVWLGASVSEQESYDRNASLLAKCSDLAPVLFLSAEPLLGEILPGLSHIKRANGSIERTDAICQIIIGVESSGQRVGSLGAFASEDEWISEAAAIVQACKESGVSCFVKQIPIGGKVSHNPAEWPKELQVREFPTAHTCAAQ